VPDEVVLMLGVETNDLNLTTAKADNDARMARVLRAAEEIGVPKSRVRTDFIGMEPRYDYDHGQRRFLGYWVRKSTAITLRDIGAFEALLSNVLEVGANDVHGIEFQTTELRTHRDTARSMALRAAREKAEAMAGQLDKEIGEPVLIREDHSGWRSWGAGNGTECITECAADRRPCRGPDGPGADFCDRPGDGDIRTGGVTSRL